MIRKMGVVIVQLFFTVEVRLVQLLFVFFEYHSKNYFIKKVRQLIKPHFHQYFCFNA